jgi:hypothetical protein
MDKITLKRLYINDKLSMMDIAQRLGVSHAKVYYWFKKYKIKRRTLSEGAYVKQNPLGDPFKIKEKLNKEEQALFISGLTLFCAEGSRNNKHAVQLANLDKRITRIFVGFLRKICGINNDKINLHVQLFRGFDKNTAIEYWERALFIPRAQIHISAHTDTRSKPEKQVSKFGIARIQINNFKLKNWLDTETNRLLDRLGR